jgi:hypothetical protein
LRKKFCEYPPSDIPGLIAAFFPFTVIPIVGSFQGVSPVVHVDVVVHLVANAELFGMDIPLAIGLNAEGNKSSWKMMLER